MKIMIEISVLNIVRILSLCHTNIRFWCTDCKSISKKHIFHSYSDLLEIDFSSLGLHPNTFNK